MTFQVEPGTMSYYGSLIERNGVNLSLVNVHLAQHTNLGSAGGVWLSKLVDAHDEMVSRMLDSIYRGFHALGESGAELRRTADYYRRTDHVSASALDASYPASTRPSIEPPDPYRTPVLDGQQGPALSSAGTDVADPRCHLKPPGQPQEFTDPLMLFNVVDDLLSPAWWLSEVLLEAIGCNPLEEVTKFVIGDWEGFARCALVWEDLSKATGAIAENVKCGLTWLAVDWTGQAADAGVHYFDQARQALGSHRDVLHRLHEKYGTPPERWPICSR
jgi:hypothetical protein